MKGDKPMNTEKHLPHDHGTQSENFLQTMPKQEIFNEVAETFNIISDSSRVKILWLLCHYEECVTNIAATVGMTSPAVSHHLRVLKQANLLTSRKVGKEVHYTLAKNHLADQVHKIVDDIFDIKCCKHNHE